MQQYLVNMMTYSVYRNVLCYLDIIKHSCDVRFLSVSPSVTLRSQWLQNPSFGPTGQNLIVSLVICLHVNEPTGLIWRPWSTEGNQWWWCLFSWNGGKPNWYSMVLHWRQSGWTQVNGSAKFNVTIFFPLIVKHWTNMEVLRHWCLWMDVIGWGGLWERMLFSHPQTLQAMRVKKIQKAGCWNKKLKHTYNIHMYIYLYDFIHIPNWCLEVDKYTLDWKIQEPPT